MRINLWLRIAACAVAAGAMLAACGQSTNDASPQGLSGQLASGGGDSRITQLENNARTVLKPASGSFLDGKSNITVLASTTPDNGDLNPYAIWPVTRTGGALTAGDVLVDNFNNKSNNQGTGSTIVDVHPDGSTTVFADLSANKSACPGGIGLTTAMVQLKTGWVIVGSLPSADGTLSTVGAGCLLVLSPDGKFNEAITGPYLNGPWDAAVADNGNTATLFVANTLIGLGHSATATAAQGNVVRLSLAQTETTAPSVVSETTVADGFGEAGDASAFVKGPTGLALGSNGTLYVADNVNNRIQQIPDALTRPDSAGAGTTFASGGQLSNPLALTFAPNGNLLVANATNGKIVEIDPSGKQLGEYYAIQNIGQDPPGSGDLFGIAVNQSGTGVLFVRDSDNVLAVLKS